MTQSYGGRLSWLAVLFWLTGCSGTSTKGNVILQYCGITEELLPKIGEVNEDKYGSFTPGSLIPIVSEDEILSLEPDFLLVLPWHFREFFECSKKFADTNLIYPI